MSIEPDNKNGQPADIGNSSNPSPHNPSPPAGTTQLLDEKAEKYLREAGNIEDMPDAQEEADAVEDGSNAG